MSEKAGREGANRAWSTRKSLSETTLPQEYLEKLEQKRKQLDESIHRYIAAKEREYKQFQKELKQQYKLSQGQDGRHDVINRPGSPDGGQDDEQTAVLEAPRISAVDALLTAERRDSDRPATGREDGVLAFQDRSAIAGLKDRRASVEREKDFLGLFTPDYLPALTAKNAPLLQRSTSAPHPLRTAEEESDTSPFERANSDSLVQAKPKRPSHLAFVQRTSSSGSSAEGKLASALKSPTQRPKQKRVSLAVGDSIVAPSDSVPTALSQNTTSSHSRKPSSVPEREYPISTKRSSTEDDAEVPSVESSLPRHDLTSQANATISEEEEAHVFPPAVKTSSPTSSLRPYSSPWKIHPDGDLFDLEDDDEALPPPQMESDSDNVLESEDDIAGRAEPVEHPGSPPGVGEMRYDPTPGLIPEPKKEDEDSVVPYLAFGPSSAIAPTKPGFRRPSVIDDPVYIGANYKAAEQDAVENDVYGSSFNRPSSKGSFTAGSLGESYMAQHAEEMMKLRTARQQAQVKS